MAAHARKRKSAYEDDDDDSDDAQEYSGRSRRSKSTAQPSSRYKGVCWSKTNRRWQAAIFVHSRNLYLGCYEEELEAAQAYDWVALKTRGAEARINFAADQYRDTDGNMLPNERLNSLVVRHEQITEATRKAQAPAAALPRAHKGHQRQQQLRQQQQQQRQQADKAEVSRAAVAAAPEASASIHPAALDMFTQQDVSLVYDKAASQLLQLAGGGGGGIQGLPELPAAALQAEHTAREPQQSKPALNPWPQLTLADLHSRLLSEQLSQELTNRLFEQPEDAELLVSQLLQQASMQLPPRRPEQRQQQEQPPGVLVQQSQQREAASHEQPPAQDVARDVLHSPAQGGSSADCLHWRAVPPPPRDNAGAAAKTAAGAQLRNAGARLRASCWPHRHHIDMGQLGSRLPQGAFLQQVVTGPFGMYGLVYGCPHDHTWGAGVWDGLEWHSVGSYECEADALRAASYVVDIGTSSCPSDDEEFDR